MEHKETGWKPGQRVRLIHNPYKVGILTDAELIVRRNRKLYQVQFPNIIERVYEDQLEPQPSERMNPIDLLVNGKLGTPNDFRRTLTHVRLTGRLADIIYSMQATNTDFYAYQFKPVLKLLQTPTNSLLIADEVGLGKTIESGLIWTELRSRFNLNRLVVLCPASLREKWRDELTNKMGVFPEICDAKEILRILKNRQSHAKGFAIIVSMEGLRPSREWEDEDKQPSNSAAFARFLRSMENEERLIDLLVVDEAHHMRNPESQTNTLGQLMKNVSEYLVLLTATPIHNYNRDLFSLLNLLDPDTFTRHDDLVEILSANGPLVRVRDLVLDAKISGEELIEELNDLKENDLLSGNRQLQTLISSLNPDSLTSFSERSRIAYTLETINLLGHAITRTRKRHVKERSVIRDPKAEFIKMTDSERDFYDLVTDIVSDYSEFRNISEAFLLVTPQRQIASCMPAALRSWKERRIDIPEDELSGTNDDKRKRRELGPLTTEIVKRSDEFTDIDELTKDDSKYNRLCNILKEFFKIHSKDKVIIFSTFRATLSYLYQRLKDDGISAIVLQGGGPGSKNDIIQEFRSPRGPSVLLSSEVGGEGVDLQFSWVVINYDLPWNPMRVEQRIGRVDRIGQKFDKVLIWNLMYDDTVDARIYKKLYNKLDLCRNALGDFEAILGDTIQKLAHKLLTEKLTPEQQEEQINRTAIALENKKREESRLEAEAAHLVAYGDYILQQVRDAHDMNRWIGASDLLIYVIDFLNMNYPGCRIRKDHSKNCECELSLTEDAKNDLDQYIRREKLTGQTRLSQISSSPVLCRFENRVISGERTTTEIISQFHPLIRFINDHISENATQLRPAVAMKIDSKRIDGDVSPGIFILAVSLWSVQGLRNVEKLVYEAIDLNAPDVLLGEGKAELLANFCATYGDLWLEVGSECDLDEVCRLVNDDLLAVMEERFEVFAEAQRAQNEDRADIQMRNLERSLKKQRETITGIIKKLSETNQMRLIPANEGRLKALEERYNRQKRIINDKRSTACDTEEICLSVILVY